MKQYLMLLNPCRETFLQDSTEAEQATVGRHFQYMKDAAERGQAILVGRTQDEVPLGLCIFEAEDDEAAEQFMNGDPAVAEGVFKAELRPYFVALQRKEAP